MSTNPSTNSSVAPSSSSTKDELSMASGESTWTASQQDNRMALWEIVIRILKTYRNDTDAVSLRRSCSTHDRRS